jgi:hypothetical protein
VILRLPSGVGGVSRRLNPCYGAYRKEDWRGAGPGKFTMKLIRLLALCSIFALSACQTTMFGDSQSDSEPRKIPCASITNTAPTYSREPIQHREQLEAQAQPMC